MMISKDSTQIERTQYRTQPDGVKAEAPRLSRKRVAAMYLALMATIGTGLEISAPDQVNGAVASAAGKVRSLPGELADHSPIATDPVDKAREDIQTAMAHPEDAPEGKYVWVRVGDSDPTHAARKFAGDDEGDFDGLKADFQANQVNDIMPQMALVEAQFVDQTNEKLQNAISPFPGDQ